MLPSKYGTPESILMARDSGNKKQLLIQNAIKMLNDREKDILYNRRLIENPLTLKELSEKYQISGERIRQIEEGALKKIKDFITNNGYENGWR